MRNAHVLVRGSVLVLVSCCACSAPSNQPPPQDRVAASTNPAVIKTAAKTDVGAKLPSRILSRSRERKGGLFTLLIVKAALTGAPGLTDANIEATLRDLLQTVRREAVAENPDGITVFLYQTVEHANGANAAVGSAEWWPEGHSFANAANVRNKATHVASINVFDLPDPAVATTKSRLPENVRREIFSALVGSEDRGTREAEARYPTNTNNIAVEQLRTYDWKTVLAKNAEYEDALQQKYQRELLSKYRISEAELDAIRDEALAQRWPLPALR